MLGQLKMGYRPHRDAERMDDITFLQGTKDIKAKFSLWPRKCRVSGKSIWFKIAYRVRHTDFGWDMDEYNIDRWYSTPEYIILRLKA